METNQLKEYRYNGARSLVLLHEHHLKCFLHTWRKANHQNVTLPGTEDPDYESLDALLKHVFRSAGGYMIWMCEKLNLQDPEIKDVPEADNIDDQSGEYLTYLLDKWRLPLSKIVEDKFQSPTYTSRWEVEYCIDAMFEHAVVHPIRHEFQLRTLIANQQNKII